MKRITVLALALVVALGVMNAPDAGAGWLNKKKPKRTEKPEWMAMPKHFDGPKMAFHSGILQQDSFSGWKLGEMKIQFAKNCEITTDGVDRGYLDAGRKAVVMGPRIGDTILAWSVKVAQPDFMAGGRSTEEVELETSEADPNCGEIIRAPR